jgi:hypothetical protein
MFPCGSRASLDTYKRLCSATLEIRDGGDCPAHDISQAVRRPKLQRRIEKSMNALVVNVIQWLVVKLVMIRHGFQFRSQSAMHLYAQMLN